MHKEVLAARFASDGLIGRAHEFNEVNRNKTA
jgi:hypothetical protein